MVAVINRSNFGGAQLVTCFTCHHGRLRPTTTIALDALYGPPNEEKDDIIAPGEGGPSVDQILDKYIAAAGGAQRLSSLKSFVATGKSLGYSEIGGSGFFQMFAQSPDQRATVIEFKNHPERGTGIRTYNGRTGWVKAPRSVVGEYDLSGNELDGVRLDAQLSFPGQIKQILKNLRAGSSDTINGQEVEVVQGTSATGILVTLFFDQQSGLLVRYVRYGKSPIGRIPTQFDFADYRDVGGIKFPFKITFSWLDGRDGYQLSEVKTNVSIDAAKFERP